MDTYLIFFPSGLFFNLHYYQSKEMEFFFKNLSFASLSLHRITNYIFIWFFFIPPGVPSCIGKLIEDCSLFPVLFIDWKCCIGFPRDFNLAPNGLKDFGLALFEVNLWWVSILASVLKLMLTVIKKDEKHRCIDK